MTTNNNEHNGQELLQLPMWMYERHELGQLHADGGPIRYEIEKHAGEVRRLVKKTREKKKQKLIDQGFFIYEGQHLPEPETFDDWTNLAVDLKELSSDQMFRGIINGLLQHIYDNDEFASDAKSRLMEVASYLGLA